MPVFQRLNPVIESKPGNEAKIPILVACSRDMATLRKFLVIFALFIILVRQNYLEFFRQAIIVIQSNFRLFFVKTDLIRPFQ